MLVLIYDEESTGLPVYDKPSNDPCQPRVTQICAELFDDVTWEVHGVLHTLIKPDGWKIPSEIAAINGITNLRCEASGLPIKNIMGVFLDMWRRADVRVGHNEGFDARMTRIEIFRCGGSQELADKWKAGRSFCTKNKASPLMKIGKTPTLSEAYEFFTGGKLDGAHNAVVDVMACKKVYRALREHGIEVA